MRSGKIVLLSLVGAAAVAVPGLGAEPQTNTHRIRPAYSPVTLKGVGSRVLSVRLRLTRPLVVWGTHGGQSNFIVDLVSPSGDEQGLYNEIGRFTGETVWADARAGNYRVKVQADGGWVLEFIQPAPWAAAPSVPRSFAGDSSHVLPIQARSTFQPVITASHTGQSNFIVDLIGYGAIHGDEGLFNEIGRFRGQTLVDTMPRGSYLLSVQADGYWRITFAR